jgi:hypothetical protein
MLDQNVVAFLSVIIGAIAIIAGLGGVILGSQLNNRSMRNEAKRKRDEEKIEEIYTLATKFDRWILDAHFDMMYAPKTDESYTLLLFRYPYEMLPMQNRITALVSLYLPQLEEETEEFFFGLGWVRQSQTFVYMAEKKGENAEKEKDEYDRATFKFEQAYKTLQSSLEKLVK